MKIFTKHKNVLLSYVFQTSQHNLKNYTIIITHLRDVTVMEKITLLK